MKRFQQRLVLTIALGVGSIIGVFKGTEARQKFVYKLMTKNVERKHVSELKRDKKKGKVLLDDIEMAAYHQQ
jgi:hypothetical protein